MPVLRRNASGRLRDLLVGILEDPAMLVFLDNGENVKAHPNENFGRELRELFSMGVGNYSEHDVREAARSFTGWTNDVLAFKFDKEQHDFGTKTFLGATGPLNGTDVIDRILEQPVTGEFVASKIYRSFVREDVAPTVRTELGRQFRASGYQMKPLLKRVFLSKDFYAPPSIATTTIGPLCSGDWQYTALDVPGTGLLQVLTRGPSGALRLVTAGTDVCTATVRAQAPPGIRTVARC